MTLSPRLWLRTLPVKVTTAPSSSRSASHGYSSPTLNGCGPRRQQFWGHISPIWITSGYGQAGRNFRQRFFSHPRIVLEGQRLHAVAEVVVTHFTGEGDDRVFIGSASQGYSSLNQSTRILPSSGGKNASAQRMFASAQPEACWRKRSLQQLDESDDPSSVASVPTNSRTGRKTEP